MALVVVIGPSNAGPGEREQMLTAASEHLVGSGLSKDQIVRIDVPGKGSGEAGDGTLRTELEPLVPLLQSGSLFGGLQGLEMVDAQNLQTAEKDMLVELLETADLSLVEVVLLWAGSPDRRLVELAKQRGSTLSVSKMWERQAGDWLKKEIAGRGLDFDRGAAEALLRHYGTDTAAMGQALDQLHEVRGKITAKLVDDRFRNRPDEPPWHITDAIARGDVGTALRRLSDFLVHGHPLVYLAALETDVRRRALAAAAPDERTFKEWVGGGSERLLSRVWSQRGQVRESALRRAQEALVRADRVIKTQPDDMHRVTLERLTVAMCRWYR